MMMMMMMKGRGSYGSPLHGTAPHVPGGAVECHKTLRLKSWFINSYLTKK
jgi:hypothetical protein